MGNSFQTQYSFAPDSLQLPYSFPTASILIGHYIFNKKNIDFMVQKVREEENLRTQLNIAAIFFFLADPHCKDLIWNYMFEGGGKHNSKIEIPSC